MAGFDKGFSLTAPSGRASVVVVRVNARDTKVTATPAELSQRIFFDPISLSTQMSECSAGKKVFYPAQHARIVRGVLDITLPQNATGLKEGELVNAAATEVARLGVPIDTFDHVMYCLPAAASPGFIASGNFSKRSVYADGFCTSMSAAMHEIGHNFALNHSGVLSGHTYGDTSCMMGFSGKSPITRKCYNAAKNDQLGWFSDRVHRFDYQTTRTWTGNLVGVADYKNASRVRGWMVAKIDRPKTGDTIYIGYNAKKGVNQDTAEGDKVIVVSAPRGGKSSRIAAIGLGESYTFQNFDGSGRNLTVWVSSRRQIGGIVDYAQVSLTTN